VIKDRSKLTTEKRNPVSSKIDTLDSLGIVRLINSEDAKVAAAVAKQARQLVAAIDLIVSAFTRGGRLFYVGAGTSGRLGVLDASECPPTYGVSPKMVQGIIAGGRGALVRSVEGAEDAADAGAAQIRKRRITERDVVVGIAACGLTPFVQGAIGQAKKFGAATVFVTFAPQAKRHIQADVIINPVVGPEVVTGSTRMKAGTATKLVLNTLTTGAMIRIGKVYGNLMVDLRATNAKLLDRSERIIISATGLARAEAKKQLTRAGGSVKLAILLYHTGLSHEQARKLLAENKGFLRRAIRQGSPK